MRRINIEPCGHHVYVETGTTVQNNLDETVTVQTPMGEQILGGICPVCNEPFLKLDFG